jgi:energy-coupling factor transporter ATP-binding protein EcfA2
LPEETEQPSSRGALQSASVLKLFGFVDHHVEIRRDATIITGPNGTGKTHFLKLVRAALVLQTEVLLDTDFQSIDVQFHDGRGLRVVRYVNDPQDSDPFVEITATREGEPHGARLKLNNDARPQRSEGMPSWIELIGGTRFTDKRNGNIVQSSYVRANWGVLPLFSRDEMLEVYPDLAPIWDAPAPVLIETSRLDEPRDEGRRDSRWREGASVATTRIDQYIQNLQREIRNAKRRSNDVTQSSDTSFAERALAVASATINEVILRERYEETVRLFNALARNSLVVGDVPIEFPSKTTPTVRRILQVFLDDWGRRLAPLVPLSERLTAYREILDDKLRLSGKHTSITPEGELEFRARSGQRIGVAQLSSGEKHLVAIFSSLLFSGAASDLVLIDEPEISLHAVWKHAFLNDVSRVASLQGLQVVLATHSTAIINSKWELTEELTFPVEQDVIIVADSDDVPQWDDAEVLDG